MKWHAGNGVFFSQQAYEKFHWLRLEALEVVKRSKEGQTPTLEDLQVLDQIYTGGPSKPSNLKHDHPGLDAWLKTDPSGLGLSGALKNDLGGYTFTALTVTRK